MKAAIETSKYIHVKVLSEFWRSNDRAHMNDLLHGFLMLVTMRDEPDAYDEMEFLREFSAGHDLGEWL
jgi:hypothetical protein